MNHSRWERRLPRVSYRMPTQVMLRNDRVHMPACTRNLSEGGLFLETPRPLAVNALVELEVALPRRLATLQGRVAWSRPGRQAQGTPSDPYQSGAGIRFVGLTETDLHQLRRAIVDSGDAVQAVRVWFGDRTEPVEMRAVLTAQGVVTTVPVPDVQLEGPVRLSFVGGNADYTGCVARTTLSTHRDGTTQLQMEIDLDSPAHEELDADEPIQITFEDDRPVTASGVISVRSRSPAEDDFADDVTPVELGLSVTSEAAQQDSVPPASDAVAPAVPAARRARIGRLLFAAIATGGLAALAGVVIIEELRDPPAGAPPVSVSPAAARPVEPTRPAPAASPPRPAVTDAPLVKPVETPPAKPVIDASPTISEVSDTIELRVPVTGPLDSIRHYTLTEPDGVALTLRCTRFVAADRGYRPGMGRVWKYWLGERDFDGAAQIRLFTRGGVPRYQVRTEPGVVIVTIERENLPD